MRLDQPVRRLCAVALAVAASMTLARAQAPAGSAALAIAGDIPHPFSVTVADLKAMPRTSVTVPEEGRDVKYEGVLMGELLKRAGAPLGRDLNGPATASYVLASAGARGVRMLEKLEVVRLRNGSDDLERLIEKSTV